MGRLLKVQRDNLPYCDRCGVRAVRWRGGVCPVCLYGGQSYRTMVKILAILGLITLLTMGIRMAWATNKQISAEAVGVSHSE